MQESGSQPDPGRAGPCSLVQLADTSREAPLHPGSAKREASWRQHRKTQQGRDTQLRPVCLLLLWPRAMLVSVRPQQDPHTRASLPMLSLFILSSERTEASSVRESVKIGRFVSRSHGVAEGLLWKAMSIRLTGVVLADHTVPSWFLSLRSKFPWKKTCAPSAAGPPILRFLKSVLPLPKFISFDSWDLQGYLLLTLAKKSSECLDSNPQNPTESSSI